MEGKPAPARIRALDWHRGLAVIVMIECHALALLSSTHDAEPFRQFLNSINGLVAPSFIYAAGFALAMVLCRAAIEPVGRRQRALKSVLRIGEVVVVAHILKWCLWPVREDPWQWLRVDILSCIAYSLLALWACVLALGNRPRTIAAIMGVLAAVIFAASPWTETVTDAGVLQYFINPKSDSPFPVLPWAGYAFLGAALGAPVAIPDRGPSYLARGLFAMLIAGFAIAWSGPLFERLYPWNPWILTNAGERIWKVAAISLLLLGAERFGNARGWAMRNPVTWVLELYGTSSLSAFYFHTTLLFGAFVWLPFGWSIFFGPLYPLMGKCGWAGYGALAVGIIALTGVLCRAWDPIDRRLPWKAKKKKPAAP